MPSAESDSSADSKTSIGQQVSAQQKKSNDRLKTYYSDESLKTSPFGDSNLGETLYRRVERATAAVHLLTSHIEEEEPLRTSLRKESIRLLDYALRVHGELRSSNSERVRRMQASIRKLISLIRTAGIIGRISDQNANILVGALDDLGNFLISSQRTTLAEAVTISRDDFIPADIRKEHPLKNKPSFKTPPLILKDKDIKDTKALRTAPSESRVERIRGFLLMGGQFGIKDISANFPEYSEKMIQRDLAAMVDSGIVKRMGEKRWSKYELVQQ